jgi:hypothetical protein
MRQVWQNAPGSRRAWWIILIGVGILVAGWAAGQAQESRRASQRSSEDTSTEQRGVNAAVTRAIKLLKDKDYEPFIEEFFPVDRLRAARKADAANGVQRVAQSMVAAPQRVQKLIEVLTRCQSVQPTIDSPRGEAVFVLSPILAEAAGEGESAQNPGAGSSVEGLGDDLDSVLAQAVQLLQRKDYAGFVASLFPVSEVERIQLRENGTDEILLVLEQQPQMIGAMLRDLSKLRSLDPVTSTADLVEFELPPPVESEPPRIVRFQLVDGNWRFFDNSSQMRAQIRQYAAGHAGPAPGEMTITWERLGQDWRLSSLDFLQ